MTELVIDGSTQREDMRSKIYQIFFSLNFKEVSIFTVQKDTVISDT